VGSTRSPRPSSPARRQRARRDVTHSIVALFPNAALLDVLAVLFLRPDQEFYQREIVDETKHKLLQVQRALHRIEDAGLLDCRRRGNRVYYAARRSHPAFEDLKRLLLKTVALGNTLRAGLQPLRGTIELAFIFGSVASGAESSSSDIDLLMVGTTTSRSITRVLGPLGRQLGREFNLVLYTSQELQAKVQDGNRFVHDVLTGPKIWLIGNEDVLAALAK
jgi:predicted nucleotidyltransferase